MSRVGCPSVWFADQAGAFIKIAKEGTYITMGKEGISLESFDIHFCPVNHGHQSHSIVERAVRRMKEAIGSLDLRLLKAGANETFNFLLICVDELNNIPLGVKGAEARGDTKTTGLFSDTITPNIRCGKTNTRRLTGMIKLQTNIEKYLMGASNTNKVLDDLLKAYLPASRKCTSQDYKTS